MAARVIWSCDQAGCLVTAEVAVTLSGGAIDGSDCWSPDGWVSVEITLCPEHVEAAMARFGRENPGAELFA